VRARARRTVLLAWVSRFSGTLPSRTVRPPTLPPSRRAALGLPGMTYDERRALKRPIAAKRPSPSSATLAHRAESQRGAREGGTEHAERHFCSNSRNGGGMLPIPLPFPLLLRRRELDRLYRLQW